MPAHLYTTKSACERAGIVFPASWVQEDINDLIRSVSAIIDRVAHGWRFIAYEETIALNGRETPRIAREDGLPIISVSAITVDPLRSPRREWAFSGDLPGYVSPQHVSSWMGEFANMTPAIDDYHVRPTKLGRAIVLSRGMWPGGVANVAVTGVFGWLDASSLKAVTTALAAELGPTTTTAALASGAGIKPRDVLVIGAGEGDVAPVALGISGANATIEAQAGVLSDVLPIGTPVRVWGAVPREIERVACVLAAREIVRRNARASNMGIDPTLLRRLKTDGGEWETHAPLAATGGGTLAWSTGDAEADATLSAFIEDCAAASAA